MAIKHYPAQFKADVVAPHRSRPDATVAEIADEFGFNRETLRNWVREDEPNDRRHRRRPKRPHGLDSNELRLSC